MKISEFHPKHGYVEIFKDVLKKIYQESHCLETANQQRMIRRVGELRDYIDSVRSLLLSKDISVDEYHELKLDCLRKIAILESKQQSGLLSLGYIKNRIEHMASAISSLEKIFGRSDVFEKRELIKLIFQDRITAEGTSFAFIVRDQAARVYGLKIGSRCCSGTTDKMIDSNHCGKILQIEREEENEITVEQAHETLAFLYGLAKLVVELVSDRKLNL